MKHVMQSRQEDKQDIKLFGFNKTTVCIIRHVNLDHQGSFKYDFSPKNFVFSWKSPIKRDVARDAQASQGHTWYQNVPKEWGYNSSYIKRVRADTLTSGGQFSEKNRHNYAPQWRKFFKKFFSSLFYRTLSNSKGLFYIARTDRHCYFRHQQAQ